MITFSIKRQDEYSRGQLILRTLFGWLYIAIPHMFLLIFVSIWGAILSMVAWWVVLFTGTYPKDWFDFQVKLLRWSTRVSAQLSNLTDSKAAYGLDGTSDVVTLDVPYPETLDRGTLLLRAFFGAFYVGIPHGICLMGVGIAASFVQMIAWWIVLFTGSYPENMFNFVVGYYRWSLRYSVYMAFMSDTYPPFTGKE